MDSILFDHLARKSLSKFGLNGILSIFGEILQSKLSCLQLGPLETFLEQSDSTKSRSSGWRTNRIETAEKNYDESLELIVCELIIE